MSLYTLSPAPWLIFLDDGGLYIPNGQLAIYVSGTMTPATTYTSAMGTAHPFPITLDSAGRVPGGLYLQPGLAYKFVLHEPQIEEPLDGGILKTQDPVDAVPRSGGSVLTLVTAGDFSSLDVAGVDIVEYRGAGDLTIRGFSGGVPGQSLLFRNMGPATVWIYNNDPAAPVGDKILNLFTIGPTPLVDFNSSARYTFISPFWQVETYEMGRPIFAAYDAANYGTAGVGGPMTWTVEPSDVIYESFFLTGRLLTYGFYFSGASVSGTPQQYLTRFLPYTWRVLSPVTNSLAGIIVSSDGGATYPVGIVLMTDPTHVGFSSAPFSAGWPPNTNGVILAGKLEVILD